MFWPLHWPGWSKIDVWQLSVSVLCASFLAVGVVGAPSLSWWSLLAFIASAVAVSLRIRFPIGALVTQIVLTLGFAFASTDFWLFPFWCLIQALLLSLGIERPRGVTLRGALAVIATLYATAFIAVGDTWWETLSSQPNVGFISWTAVCAVSGMAIRAHRQYISALQDRALQAIQSRETEARHRVSEERLRIARELHDVVGHHMAVVSVFTGLARTALPASPDQAEIALAKVQEASKTVLSELQQILRVLRETDDIDGNAMLPLEAPMPSFAMVPDLLASFEAIGLPIRFRQLGEPSQLSDAVGLTAHRVIQEALTNAHKHGSGVVDIRITFDPEAMTIAVTNPAALPWKNRHEPGFGLVGMRERIRMIGGSLDYGIEAGEFSVVARLPLDDTHLPG